MLTTILLLLLGIVTILVIIAANGYFVAQEFAYMSVDRNKMAAQAEAGDAAAGRVLKVTERTSFMLSGAQLGITVTGLLVGFVAEPMVGETLGELLGVAGVPTAVSVSIGTVLALAVATVVQMVLGELYPKNLAVASPEPLARALARSTGIYLTMFGWLIVVFDRASNGLLRLVRVEPVHDLDSSATAADLERIVADARASGELPERLSVLIDRILDFPDRTVEHAMVPRPQADSVAPDLTVAEARALMAREHTRYPVVSKDLEPVGVIQLADVLRHGAGSEAGPDAGYRAQSDAGSEAGSRARSDDPVSELMREPVVVPTLMSLPDALATLTRERAQLAAVIDEYGGFAGVITLEDLAEELVGELTDEHDETIDSAILDEGENCWRMEGDVHIDEVERALGHQLPQGDFETIAGLAIATHGELPEQGSQVWVDLPVQPRELVAADPIRFALRIEVVEVAHLVPSVVVVRLVEIHDDDEAAALEADDPARDETDRAGPAHRHTDETRHDRGAADPRGEA